MTTERVGERNRGHGAAAYDAGPSSDRSQGRSGSVALSSTVVPEPERPLSALPSTRARVLAFGAILVGGLAGALIGFGFVDIQCTGKCTTPNAIGALTGAVLAALGTAVVAVLALRAMGEWRQMGDRAGRGRA